MKWDWNKSQLLQNGPLQKTETPNRPPIVVFVVSYIDFNWLQGDTGVIFINFFTHQSPCVPV